MVTNIFVPIPYFYYIAPLRAPLLLERYCSGYVRLVATAALGMGITGVRIPYSVVLFKSKAGTEINRGFKFLS